MVCIGHGTAFLKKYRDIFATSEQSRYVHTFRRPLLKNSTEYIFGSIFKYLNVNEYGFTRSALIDFRLLHKNREISGREFGILLVALWKPYYQSQA